MTIEFNQLGNIESFYQDFEEDYDEGYERTETIELPDECTLDEATTVEGAFDAMKHIRPVSLT